MLLSLQIVSQFQPGVAYKSVAYWKMREMGLLLSTSELTELNTMIAGLFLNF